MVLSQVLNVYFLFEKPGLGTGTRDNDKRGQGREGAGRAAESCRLEER